MEVILKPLITEKMAGQTEKSGVVGFLVDISANKLQIKEAVEKMYGVKVSSVNTMLSAGKKRNRNTRTKFITGYTSARKKAVVKLAEGSSIDFYSNI